MERIRSRAAGENFRACPTGNHVVATARIKPLDPEGNQICIYIAIVGDDDRIGTATADEGIGAIADQNIVAVAAVKNVGTAAAGQQIGSNAAAKAIRPSTAELRRTPAWDRHARRGQNDRHGRARRHAIAVRRLGRYRANAELEPTFGGSRHIHQKIVQLRPCQAPHPATEIGARRQAHARRHAAHLDA